MRRSRSPRDWSSKRLRRAQRRPSRRRGGEDHASRSGIARLHKVSGDLALPGGLGQVTGAAPRYFRVDKQSVATASPVPTVSP
jgi:hypothetical protein